MLTKVRAYDHSSQLAFSISTFNMTKASSKGSGESQMRVGLGGVLKLEVCDQQLRCYSYFLG